jgi:hypothetical protein
VLEEEVYYQIILHIPSVNGSYIKSFAQWFNINEVTAGGETWHFERLTARPYLLFKALPINTTSTAANLYQRSAPVHDYLIAYSRSRSSKYLNPLGTSKKFQYHSKHDREQDSKTQSKSRRWECIQNKYGQDRKCRWYHNSDQITGFDEFWIRIRRQPRFNIDYPASLDLLTADTMEDSGHDAHDEFGEGIRVFSWFAEWNVFCYIFWFPGVKLGATRFRCEVVATFGICEPVL